MTRVKAVGVTGEAMDPHAILSRIPAVAYVRKAAVEGEVFYVSPRSESLLGYGPQDFAARPSLWDEITHPEDLAFRREEWARACRGGNFFSCGYRVTGRGDRLVSVRDEASFECDEDGVPVLAHGVLLEVPAASARRGVEDRMINSQKWEAVGRLTGGVAHDFSNLLSVIQNYAAFLEASLEPQDSRRNDVEEIRRAGDRASALIRQFLTFSRRDAVKLELVNLNEIIIDIEHLLRSSIGEDVDLTTKLARGLWLTKIDVGQVEQMLANLAVNAREAMPGCGRLAIETFNVSAHESLVFGSSGLPMGRYVCLAVSDDGRGIGFDEQGRMFEPFFTTKPAGEGTGLGLAIVRDVMEQTGGHVSVTSHAGRGSSFKLLFRASDNTDSVLDSAPGRTPADGAGERVIVVEDEGAVRRLIERILGAANYEVETATANEAIELFESSDYRADLLLTDVIMPDMSGRELLERLQQLGAAPRTLFMSGHAEEMIARHKILSEGAVFLQKPFVAEELLEAVRAALDGAESSSPA